MLSWPWGSAEVLILVDADSRCDEGSTVPDIGDVPTAVLPE